MKAELRKQQILDCAKKVFARHGYHKANIAMICKKAGIGRGTLYQYFENKKAVFEAILEDIFTKMISEMSQGLDPAESSYSTEAELMAIHSRTLERGFNVWVKDRDFARIAFQMSLGISKEFTEMRHRFDKVNIDLIKKRLEKIKRKGFFREDLDTELAAIQIHGSMEKIITTLIVDQNKKLDSDEVKKLMDEITRFHLFGMINSNKKDG